MKSVKYLDDVAKKFDLKNDSALARKLNVRPNTISQYRSGARIMDEETCLAVALALEIDPTKILMAAGIDRAEKSGQKSLWEIFSQRMATAVSAILLALIALFATVTPKDSYAAARKGPFPPRNNKHSRLFVFIREKLAVIC